MGVKDYSDEDEEYDEEEEEEVERTRKRRRGSQFIDDAAEEDDEEDDDEDLPRSKKGLKKKSRFIDDSADVASDDEEEDDLEEEDELIEDDGADLGPEEERPRLHRPLRHEPEQDNIDDLEKYIQERYGNQDQGLYDEAETTEVEQQALLPSVKDPKLWKVKCLIGHEREAVVSLMQKYINMRAEGAPLLIKSAVSPDNLKGAVYVESEKDAYVKLACKGLRLIYSSKPVLVPIKEMAVVLTVEKKAVDLDHGAWVRMRTGVYKGDLAKVQDMDSVKSTATIKLIPRIDLESVAAKQDGREEVKKRKGTRPVARFFSREDLSARNIKASEKRDPETGEMLDIIGGMKFDKAGYLFKTVALKSLDTRNVVPTLDELQRFQREAEDGQVDDLLSGLGLLAPSQAAQSRGRLLKGDVVQVIEGDLKGLMGVVEKVDSDEVIILPKHKDLKDSLPVKERQLSKFFKTGDHVKVIAGQHEGATGMIVKVEPQTVVLLSDSTNEHVKVFSRDIASSAEVTSGPTSLGQYDLHDLILLDQNGFGVIVKVEPDGCQVLKGNPERVEVVPLKLRDIRRKLFDRNTTAQGCDGNIISLKDPIHVVEGPYKGKHGVVEHINRGILFIYDRAHVDNGGYLCVRSYACRAMGGVRSGSGNGSRAGISNDFGRMQSGLNSALRSPAHIMQSPSRQFSGNGPPSSFGGGRMGHRRDNGLVGRTVKIRSGPYKGYKGRVVDATDSTARVELESQMKVVTVRRDQLPEGGDDQQGSRTPFRESPRYGAGSETPMHPSRTPVHPSWGGMRDPTATPIHEGMRTPMRDRAWNPQVPTTPLRNDVWEDANPGSWSVNAIPQDTYAPVYSPAEAATPGVSQIPGTPGMPTYEAPTPGAGWGAAAGGYGEGMAEMSSYPGAAPSPYFANPGTPGGQPMTPGAPAAYLPSTPGGMPMTPGNGAMNPATPAGSMGQAFSWQLPDIAVTVSHPGTEGPGVIREVLEDGSCRVAMGLAGEGEVLIVPPASLDLVQPKKNDRVKVLDGVYVGKVGKMISVDSSEGIIKLDPDRTKRKDAEDDDEERREEEEKGEIIFVQIVQIGRLVL